MSAPSITMQQWWLLLAVMLVSLGLLYLLKPRRRKVEVPFGGLWQQVLAQVEARTMGGRWRRFLSWLCMVAMSLSMLLALGESLLGLHGCSSPPQPSRAHTVVVLDVSASMATGDGRSVGGADVGKSASVSRLTEARGRIGTLLEAARTGERFLLMTASSRLKTRCGWTTDRHIIERALDSVRVGSAGLDLRRALAAARDALSGRSHGRVVLVTDGGPPLSVSKRPAGLRIETISVGPGRTSKTTGVSNRASFDNIAVEQVTVRPTPADPGHGTLTVRLRNDRASDTAARVLFYSKRSGRSSQDLADSTSLRGVRQLTMAPRSETTVQIDDLDLSAERFAVRVQPQEEAKWRDLAAYDDWGFAVLAARRRLSVLLVSAGNLFLEAALHANSRLVVHRLAPQAYRPGQWRGALRGRHGIDIVVLDQVVKPLPVGMPGLRFDRQPHAHTVPGDQVLAGSSLVNLAPDHPVMRGVSFQDVNVDSTRRLKPPDGAVVLAGIAGRGPVAVATSGDMRAVTVALDLLESDLGGRYTLPILVGNAIDWLAGEDQDLLSALEVGRVWSIQAPFRDGSWQYLEPGAAAVPARRSGDQLIASSEAHGIHEWRGPHDVRVARPTRLPVTERPGQWQSEYKAWRLPPTGEQARHQPAPQPVWLWLLLSVALALVIEWALYMRRRTL